MGRPKKVVEEVVAVEEVAAVADEVCTNCDNSGRCCIVCRAGMEVV